MSEYIPPKGQAVEDMEEDLHGLILPDEVILKVFSFLPVVQLSKLARVSVSNSIELPWIGV